MKGQNGSYAMKRTLELDFDEVDRRVRDALGEEGFGVLTEIDVKVADRVEEENA